MYRDDVSSVTNVCTVLFPKRIVPLGRMLFYKRKIRIAAICLGLQNTLNFTTTVLFTTIMEQIGL